MSGLTLPRSRALIVPGRYARPMAPQEFVDATEEWARKSGRHCTWRWSREMECWTLNLTMAPDAPVMRAYQEGRLPQAEPPTEGVPLMERDPKTGRWRGLDLEQWGPSGIVRLLEEADLWSGRGKNRSLLEVVEETVERQRERREKQRVDQRNMIRDWASDIYRQVAKVPFHRVGIDLRKGSGGEQQQ